MTYQIHPAAELFPLIEGAEFDALVADVRANGLIDPIVVAGGLVLDGRNRLRACEVAGIEPRYREIETEDPVAYITSTNVHRRHLTTAQRAAIAADLATMGRGNPSERNPDGTFQPKGSNDPFGSNAISIDQAARLMNVSAPSVKRARQRKAKDPESHEAIKRGAKPPKPQAESGAEDREMGSSNRTYRTIAKVANTTYAQLTGNVMQGSWARETIGPTIMDHIPWTVDYNWAKEITEEQAEEVRKVVTDWASREHAELIAKAEADRVFKETESLKAMMSLTAQKKLDRAIELERQRLLAEMQAAFDQEIEHAIAASLGEREAALEALRAQIQQELDAARQDRALAKAERQKAIDIRMGIDSHMTEQEYKLVLSCLHPDRQPEEQRPKYDKAFHIFKRLEKSVNDKLPIAVLRERGWEKKSPFCRKPKTSD